MFIKMSDGINTSVAIDGKEESQPFQTDGKVTIRKLPTNNTHQGGSTNCNCSMCAILCVPVACAGSCGSIYLHDCPRAPALPILMIRYENYINYIIKMSDGLSKSVAIDVNEVSQPLQTEDKVTITNLQPPSTSERSIYSRVDCPAAPAIPILMIMDVAIIVYHARFPNFEDSASDDYCHPNLYLTAYWILNILFGVAAIAIAIFCCCFLPKLISKKKLVEVKHIADIVGEWGKWQFMLFSHCFLFFGSAAFVNMGYVFHAKRVDFWCADTPTNLTSQHLSDETKCHKYSNPNESCTHWEYNRTQFRKTIITEFDLVCDRANFASLTQSVFMLGYVVSGLVLSHYKDKYGRRPVVLLCYCSSVVALNIVPPYAYWLQDFRYMQLISALPLLAMLIWFYCLHESPRWQLINGQTARAEVIIKKALTMNGKSVDNLSEQMRQLANSMQTTPEANKKEKGHNVLDLFKTPNIRKYTFIIWYGQAINALIYYGLSLNMGDFGGNFYVTFLLMGLMELPAQVLLPLFLRYIGRRKVYAMFMIITAMSCVAVVFSQSQSSWLRVLLALVAKYGISSSWMALSVHGSEIYPTVVRNTGQGVASVVGRVGSISGPFMGNLASVTSLTFVMCSCEVMVKVKHIADIVGEWGKWQSLFFTHCILLWATEAFVNMGFVFHTKRVDFWCADTPNNLTSQHLSDETKCHKYLNPNESCTHWEYNRTQFHKTIITEFDLVCDRANYAPLTQSCFIMGYVFSGLIVSHFSDKYGRRPVVFICYAIEILGVISCAFSYNIYQYLISRFLTGLGYSGLNGALFKSIKTKKGHNLLDLFKTPNMRKYTLILWYAWVVNAVIYYGISLNMGDFGGNFYISFLLSGLMELPANLLTPLFLRYIGRRKLYAIFMIITGASCVAVIAADRSSWLRAVNRRADLSLSTVNSQRIVLLAHHLWGIWYINCSNKTRQQPKHCASVTSLTFVMVLYGVLTAVGAILVLYLPETKGKEIPDTLEEAENLDKNNPRLNREECSRVEVKHIADIVGEWGKWQFILCAHCFLLWSSAAFINMGYAFHAKRVDFWCADTPTNLTFDLVCNRANYASLTQAFFMLGYVVSGLIVAHYSDKYGRRPMVLMCYVVEILGIISCAFSYNIYQYLISRLLVGVGYSGLSRATEYSSAVALNIDQIYKSWPELVGDANLSPRWQLANGQIDRAEVTIRKALQMNGKSVDNLKVQMQQLKVDKKEKVNALIYYGLSFNMGDFGGNFYVTFVLSGLMELPAQLLTLVLLRYIGRRKLYAIFMIITALSCVAVIAADQSSWLRVLLALVGKYGISSSWNVIQIHGSEIYPTVVRNIAVGIASVVGRVGSISAPFMGNLASVTSLTFVMVLYSVLTAVGAVLVLYLPETKDKEIPDTLEEAENLYQNNII
ncbi:unnamed protein product [Medioppia subpectinata]|uniref:Major facilitator superfamily (MFS) profile domain-containing protein n=1 Tax=Medioppia subpectinata TaxID=1979941 RepID=A0A7R9PT52_9ACAR|nr:unnamed protein product [Medioppia subpectinata]CAG2100137.1 unnamed protein product [Medioppia subpectinata]